LGVIVVVVVVVVVVVQYTNTLKLHLLNVTFNFFAGYNILDIFCFHAKLELVDKFCCLGDMLSVDGDADAAVEARIRIGWNKFRQLCHCLPIRTCL